MPANKTHVAPYKFLLKMLVSSTGYHGVGICGANFRYL